MKLSLVAVVMAALFRSVLITDAASYTLSISTTGSGLVSRNPTNSTYPAGSVVTLTASPASNWLFNAWSGDTNGSANPLNLTMDTNKTVAANFQPIPFYSLSVSNLGEGFVTPSTGSYRSNTVLLLTATASNGWRFLNWSGDLSGTNNPAGITMSGDRSVSASFVQPPAIMSEPQDVAASRGASATFVVNAIGDGPLSYQWQMNGIPVQLRTGDTLTLTNVQPGDEGGYSVVVSNAYGTATSRSALLSIPGSCTGTNVVGTCTEAALRLAIGHGGIVTFCCNGTITLTNTITVTKTVALDATDRRVVIDGGNAVRLFNVRTGITFSATNVMFANGFHQGTNGVDGSAAPAGIGAGGAISNSGGAIVLVSCVLSNNQAQGGRGGNDPGGKGGDGRGGAIHNSGGTISLVGVRALTNSALGGVPGFTTCCPTVPNIAGQGLGGLIYNAGGTVLIDSSIVESNQAYSAAGQIAVTSEGGAIYQASGGLVISNSTFTGQNAFGESGFRGSYQKLPPHAFGGALSIAAGGLTMDRTRFVRNRATGGAGIFLGAGEARGGAIFTTGTNWISNCTFLENEANAADDSSQSASGRGGGVYDAGPLVVIGSTFASNIARGGHGAGPVNSAVPGGDAFGGAIFSASTLAVTNSTFTLNESLGGATGNSFDPRPNISGGAFGGALYATGAVVRIMNVTLATNFATPGAYPVGSSPGSALGADLFITNSAVTVRNSLLAGSGTNGNSWGPLIDGGYNISSDGSANFSSGSSFNFTDPKLLPLEDNGGPTLTMALDPISPAIDTAAATGAPAVDQRGRSRPVGPGFDMGAYEAGPPSPALVVRQITPGIEVSFSMEPGAGYDIDYSMNLETWYLQESIPARTTNSVVTRIYSNPGQGYRFYRVRVP